MEEKTDMDKADEIMLPGFRFHPTDEELVGFYLRRKIQQKPLSIELIRQLDIYKYDPWDLPKMATTGEKEWYFYCPRDRKYRNSVRPNRVTKAGFWKATGTDRPIYSSEGSKCIGLKKSLVFYKGRAAKGVKTDWMMHEFRLPSLNDPSISKKAFDKNFIPASVSYLTLCHYGQETWAICRIFKKNNFSAQRALSHSWAIPLAEDADFHKLSLPCAINGSQFGSENTREFGSLIQFGCSSSLEQHASAVTYSSLDVTTLKPINMINCKPSEMLTRFIFSQPETPNDSQPSEDVTSMLPNLSSSVLQDLKKPSQSLEFGQQQQTSFFLEENTEEECIIAKKNMSFPFNLAPNPSEEWKPNLPWDYTLFLSEMSTSYSASRCDV